MAGNSSFSPTKKLPNYVEALTLHHLCELQCTDLGSDLFGINHWTALRSVEILLMGFATRLVQPQQQLLPFSLTPWVFVSC